MKTKSLINQGVIYIYPMAKIFSVGEGMAHTSIQEILTFRKLARCINHIIEIFSAPAKNCATMMNIMKKVTSRAGNVLKNHEDGRVYDH